MLPILNRPLIDYVVDDCLQAGITKIVFVISEHNTQLIHFYRENMRLKNYLERMHKSEQYAQVEKLHQKAEFHFVRQSDDDLYGTATPVKLAADYVKDEDAFLVLMGDDFIYNADGSSETERMIHTFSDAQATGLACCIAKPDAELHKYGVAETREQDGKLFLTDLIEKPSPGEAPSNLANISKYIFTPAIFPLIEAQQPNPASGELYITDTIAQLARNTQKVIIHQPQGTYLDGGFTLGWLRANLTVALSSPDLADETRAMLQELSEQN